MSTMNVSLPESLKSFVDEQVASRRYGTSSEYVRELIRKDLERRTLRDLLLQGAESAPGAVVDRGYFAALRRRARRRKAK
jgi:antitoxin ParD1/3/4